MENIEKFGSELLQSSRGEQLRRLADSAEGRSLSEKLDSAEVERIARVAFNRYNTMRKDLGGRIHTWNDPFLGDQEFYAAVVAPLVADLDAAGERLMKPAPDSEIEEFYQKYVPQWAEINIVLAERRAAYLKTEFLTPPAKK